jgi:hypothetical protein
MNKNYSSSNSYLNNLTNASLESNKYVKSQNNNQKEYFIFDFENEKENILRLDRGVLDLITTLEKYVSILEERTNSLKVISEITKNLDNSLFNIKNHQKGYGVIDKKYFDGYIFKNVNYISKDSLLEKLFEKNRKFKDNINSNILDKLRVI